MDDDKNKRGQAPDALAQETDVPSSDPKMGSVLPGNGGRDFPDSDAGSDAEVGSYSEHPTQPVSGKLDVASGALNDRYDVRGQVGEGGTSQVFQALDQRLSRFAALKVLSKQHVDALGDSFEEEAKLTALLEHPGVIPVHDMGVDGEGRPFLSMKLVQGITLADRLEQLGDSRLDLDKLASLVEVLERVCDVLAYAHNWSIVHCDVKPENIMVGEFGEVYLLDWGIAHSLGRGQLSPTSQARERGETVGTPAYMAPEQAGGEIEKLGPCTDIFGMGAVLYHALTGRAPFAGPNMMASLYEAMKCEPTPPEKVLEEMQFEAPAGLGRIAMRAMSKDPADRYASVLELRDDLQKCLRVTASVVLRHFEAESVVFNEGDRGDCAYVVRKGQCVAFTQRDGIRHDVARIKTGEIFGEMAVISGMPRSLSVRAVTSVTLVEINGETLSSMTGLDSWAGVFLRTVVARLRESTAQNISGTV